ncbi:MAG: DUF3575 domain-containing protein [Bacteroidales bacterium]|nr:DUF3575 domain-containing protein [Bacteroidales bacterium]
MIFRRYLTALTLLIITTGLSAQDFAIKSNVLYDVTKTLNAGIEIGGGRPELTFDISGSYCPFERAGGAIWKHAFIQPEARWWFCNRFDGHFLSAHLHGGIYNVGNIDTGLKFLGSDFSQLRDHRFQGWFVGAGIGYGYALILSRHWNLEFELGLGYAYARGDKFECEECGDTIYENRPSHYVGPTKAAICIVYLF